MTKVSPDPDKIEYQIVFEIFSYTDVVLNYPSWKEDRTNYLIWSALSSIASLIDRVSCRWRQKRIFRLSDVGIPPGLP